MKNYTKQITAFAVLSLFAYSANAQSAIYTGNWVDADYNNNILSGLTITPQASVDPAFLVPVAAEELNIVATTSEIDPETGVITTTIVNQLTKWTGTDTTVSPGDSVVINNSGITLNQVTTRTDSLELFVRVTEVSINDGLGNVDSITSEWTAVAYTSDDTEIPETAFTSALSEQDAYNKIADSLLASTADTNELEDALTEGEPTSTGGNLYVGGELVIAAEFQGQPTIIPVGEAIVSLAETIGVFGEELDTEADTLIGAINEVDAAIATEVADRTALIRLENDGIHIGAESFVFDDADVDGHRLFTSDGSDLILGKNGSDVVISDDLSVNGDVFFNQDLFVADDIYIDGNVFGVQEQLDTNAGAIANNSSRIDRNKKDIETNTRGIAMVAALQHTTVLPGMNNAFDLSAAHFEGETGMALNYARRLSENVQVNFGAASTTDFDESVIKAGIGVQW